MAGSVNGAAFGAESLPDQPLAFVGAPEASQEVRPQRGLAQEARQFGEDGAVVRGGRCARGLARAEVRIDERPIVSEGQPGVPVPAERTRLREGEPQPVIEVVALPPEPPSAPCSYRIRGRGLATSPDTPLSLLRRATRDRLLGAGTELPHPDSCWASHTGGGDVRPNFWVTDMTHFLDEHGRFADIPAPPAVSPDTSLPS